jgi:ubiquinone/menaquinone biosynthesis C-methylase UbiE
MLTEILVQTRVGRSLIRRLGRQRTRDVVSDISGYLQPEDRVIDIGAGTCDVTAALLEGGFNVVAADISDLSCIEGVTPVLFDGRRLPFSADAFDVGLLINVLHHTREPDQILCEASRVARRLVIHEDIYESRVQRALTLLMDSATNLEFFGHPHSNRDDQEWRQTFEALGLELVDAKYKTFWAVFANATYMIERRGDPSR